MTELLQVNQLCRSFGALQVTRNVSFSLAQGDRIALIGPNGAGKTSLVNLISGSLRASSGTVRFKGRDVTALDQAERARLGLIRTYQVTRLFRAMTVADNVRLALLQRARQSMRMFRPVAEMRELEEKTQRVLQLLQLADRHGTAVDRLAYGEQRLVEIALAIALEPQVLLLDEPAAGVPQGESHVIFSALSRLPGEMAVMLIEHDMDLVFRFAKEIVVLVAGAVMLRGTPAQVAQDDRVRQLYLGEAGRSVSLSDTVGFIRDLPHGLIDAFQATLQEAADADLLLHVVDAANPGFPEQMVEVQRVLREIGADLVPQVLVFNKVDALAPDQRPLKRIDRFDVEGVAVPRVFVSARSGEGLKELREQLAAMVESAMPGQDAVDKPERFGEEAF